EFTKLRTDHRACGKTRNEKSEATSGFGMQTRDRCECRPDGAQSRAEISEHLLACVGRRNAAGGPIEKTYADLLFQASNRMAETRRRHVQSLRSLCKAPFFRNRDESR